MTTLDYRRGLLDAAMAARKCAEDFRVQASMSEAMDGKWSKGAVFALRVFAEEMEAAASASKIVEAKGKQNGSG